MYWGVVGETSTHQTGTATTEKYNFLCLLPPPAHIVGTTYKHAPNYRDQARRVIYNIVALFGGVRGVKPASSLPTRYASLGGFHTTACTYVLLRFYQGENRGNSAALRAGRTAASSALINTHPHPGVYSTPSPLKTPLSSTDT